MERIRNRSEIRRDWIALRDSLRESKQSKSYKYHKILKSLIPSKDSKPFSESNIFLRPKLRVIKTSLEPCASFEICVGGWIMCIAPLMLTKKSSPMSIIPFTRKICVPYL